MGKGVINMKLNEMSLEELKERKVYLENKINDLAWMKDEANELEEDLQPYFLQPLTIVETELKRVNKEIDHWYDF